MLQRKLTGLCFFKATLKLFKRGIFSLNLKYPVIYLNFFGPENDKL